MRDLIVSTFITLDGVMQAPGGPEEDPSGGFSFGGWSVDYWDEPMMEKMGEATSGPFEGGSGCFRSSSGRASGCSAKFGAEGRITTPLGASILPSRGGSVQAGPGWCDLALHRGDPLSA